MHNFDHVFIDSVKHVGDEVMIHTTIGSYPAIGFFERLPEDVFDGSALSKTYSTSFEANCEDVPAPKEVKSIERLGEVWRVSNFEQVDEVIIFSLKR